jgi:hypothetical protein
MSEYNEGDKVRITFKNGSVAEGVVNTDAVGNKGISVGYLSWFNIEDGDRKVEVIEKAKPKPPTKSGSLVRVAGVIYKLSGIGNWYAWGDETSQTERIAYSDWEEVVVVPKAALDKLRKSHTNYGGNQCVPALATRDFLKAVDGE